MADSDGATPAAELPDDPPWDDRGTPLTAPAVPVLRLDGFGGPMDLLLDLAQRQLIDLGRLSIAVLAQQFVAELEGRLCAAPIERRADWLVVAARLLQLRSRLLFPASPAVAADAQRDAARTLAALEAMRWARATADWLDERPQLGRDVFVRPLGRSSRTASYMALMEAVWPRCGSVTASPRPSQPPGGSTWWMSGGWATSWRMSAPGSSSTWVAT